MLNTILWIYGFYPGYKLALSLSDVEPNEFHCAPRILPYLPIPLDQSDGTQFPSHIMDWVRVKVHTFTYQVNCRIEPEPPTILS